MSPQLIVAGLVALGAGAVGFVLLGGGSNAEKRMASLGREERRAAAVSVDRAAKKKQVANSLKDLDRKRQGKRADLETQLQQAGLSITKAQFFMFCAIAGVMLAAVVWIKSQSPGFTLAAALIGGAGLPRFVIGRMKKRRIKKFIDGLPGAIDLIVRGVRSGLPLGDTIRLVANEANEPVKSEFRHVVEAQAVGLPLPEAVERLTQRVPITETNFFSIVIAIQTKAGGNLSEALANLSKVLRERKAMKGKIGAMSMEATASAAIIGCVPFVVTGLLYASSPHYISLLWSTQHGRVAALVGLVWMSIGGFVMKKMINFDF
jgi:tight adherence protein B